MGKDVEQSADNFEQLLASKNLSKSTRIYIRRLKQEGLIDEANLVRKQELERKGASSKAQRAEDDLHSNVSIVLNTTDPKAEIQASIQMVWQRFALARHEGQVLDKNEEINEILDALENKNPDLFNYALSIMPSIRDDAENKYIA